MRENNNIGQFLLFCIIIFLFSALIIFLHWMNAVSAVTTLLDNEVETIISDNLEDNYVIDQIIEKSGVLMISGMVISDNIPQFRYHIGLWEQRKHEITVLKTQMQRRFELNEYGKDDHGGYVATIRTRNLLDGKYQVVLIDETGEQRKMRVSTVKVLKKEDSLEKLNEEDAL